MRLESVATSDRRETAALDLIERQEHVLQVIDPWPDLMGQAGQHWSIELLHNN